MAPTKAQGKAADRLLRLLDQRLPKGETMLQRLDAEAAHVGRPVHAELLKLLTHLSYPNEEARQVWSGFQVHRATLERRLGRDVGPRVALFDYLMNVDRRLSNPKIIEVNDFEKTEKSAITDHLTGLFNRAHFDSCLKKEINRCRRYGQTVSLIMLDLDEFKQVNDAHGHQAGDAVLRDVGRLLVQRVRDIDVAARYGGEEFAIIVPETRRTSAFVVAERIRSEVERFFKRKGAGAHDMHVTLSGGIASHPEDAETPETLLARADEALYRAKRAGRNLVSIYYQEKRRASRVPIASPAIQVYLKDQPSVGAEICKGLNISEGGILLQTTRKLEVGQSLEMRLAVNGEEQLELLAEVIRLEERSNGRRKKLYDAALRFRFGRRSRPESLTRFLQESAPSTA
ncbi:MAG TPA: diguanylate cyclase [Patescibacteria group bacterium]|jgi:diguanylate cyclase (GGDEF)-like protein|nr:diguanylate cyclase [Patescibacteria group bacterium]